MTAGSKVKPESWKGGAVPMDAGHHDEDGASLESTAKKAELTINFTGCFQARIWDLDCLLELRPDGLGGLQGFFNADGEWLELSVTAPDALGEVRGVIRAANLEEPFAHFRARAQLDDLLLEIHLTDAEPDLEVLRVTFTRLQ